MSFMEKQVLSYKSLLFGRKIAQIKLIRNSLFKALYIHKAFFAYKKTLVYILITSQRFRNRIF